MRLENLLNLVLRLELCLLQAKGLCSGSDIIFPSTLLRLGLGNKYEARPSVILSTLTEIHVLRRRMTVYLGSWDFGMGRSQVNWGQTIQTDHL